MPSDMGYRNNWGKIIFQHLGSEDTGALMVEFKAFVKRFTDNFDGDWKESQYPNQSVPIAHQVRPRRSLHIEWTVPAANEAEAISNLAKCSALAQMMFPTLQRADRWGGKHDMFYPRSSFIGIKFANFIQKPDGSPLPGYVKGFNYTPNFEEGVYVTNKKKAQIPKEMKDVIATSSKTEGILAPMFVDIALDFVPFYIRSEVGYIHGEGWTDARWPYGADFEWITDDADDWEDSAELCLNNAKEKGFAGYDVCARSATGGRNTILG